MADYKELLQDFLKKIEVAKSEVLESWHLGQEFPRHYESLQSIESAGLRAIISASRTTDKKKPHQSIASVSEAKSISKAVKVPVTASLPKTESISTTKKVRVISVDEERLPIDAAYTEEAGKKLLMDQDTIELLYKLHESISEPELEEQLESIMNEDYYDDPDTIEIEIEKDLNQVKDLFSEEMQRCNLTSQAVSRLKKQRSIRSITSEEVEVMIEIIQEYSNRLHKLFGLFTFEVTKNLKNRLLEGRKCKQSDVCIEEASES